MTPEGKVKQKIRDWVKVNMPGCKRIAVRGGPFGQIGVSDDIIMWHGFFIAIEAKADDTCDASDMQRKFLEDVRDGGGIACLMKGYEERKLLMIKDIVLHRKRALDLGLSLLNPPPKRDNKR